jgi:hypothetical protein
MIFKQVGGKVQVLTRPLTSINPHLGGDRIIDAEAGEFRFPVTGETEATAPPSDGSEVLTRDVYVWELANGKQYRTWKEVQRDRVSLNILNAVGKGAVWIEEQRPALDREEAVKVIARVLHGLWWVSWYEQHGGHVGGQVNVMDVMPPVPKLVMDIAAKVWDFYPPEGSNVDNYYYAEDLAYSIVGSGGGSGHSDTTHVDYDLEQTSYQDGGMTHTESDDDLEVINALNNHELLLVCIPEKYLTELPGTKPSHVQPIPEYNEGSWASNALTVHDMNHLYKIWQKRVDDNQRPEDDSNYDEGAGPEPVMVSFGYVDVWIDGEVTWKNHVIKLAD